MIERSAAADPSEPSPVMHIGAVAARTGLSLRSLRHWDDVGLLRPSGRTEGGFRLYTEDDVEKILIIRRMKPLGFTLDQMGEAMRDLEVLHSDADASTGASARTRLAAVLTDAHERRASLERQLSMADEFIDLLGGQLS